MNISYELAKELKDAGFPQMGAFGYRMIADGKSASIKECEEHPEIIVYIPTLSELIEACGEQDFELNREDTGKPWTACSRMKLGVGSTPEEAVARLWLALTT